MVWKGTTFCSRLLLWYCRRVSYHRGKTRLSLFLARTFWPKGIPMVLQNKARLNVDAMDYIGHAILNGGHYEPRSLKLACKIMSGGGCFIDVGANFGLYAMAVTGVTRCTSFAFEPYYKNFQRLQDNHSLNPDFDCILVNAALGSESSIIPFGTLSESNLGTARMMAAGTGGSQKHTWVATLPFALLPSKLGVNDVKLMKIDVEGAELEVLNGIFQDGVSKPPHLIIEHLLENASSDKFDALHALLLSQGYVAKTVEGQLYSPTVNVPEDNLWWSLSN